MYLFSYLAQGRAGVCGLDALDAYCRLARPLAFRGENSAGNLLKWGNGFGTANGGIRSTIWRDG